ncbi:MAG: hypothetical protein WDO15_01935 [Bacteroidota bacterium]
MIISGLSIFLHCRLLSCPSFIIFIVLFASRKRAQQMSLAGKRILSFQILWTIATALLLVIIPMLQFTLTNSRVIGHFPPTFVYSVYDVVDGQCRPYDPRIVSHR